MFNSKVLGRVVYQTSRKSPVVDLAHELKVTQVARALELCPERCNPIVCALIYLDMSDDLKAILLFLSGVSVFTDIPKEARLSEVIGKVVDA